MKKWIVITGAGSGIGAATAIELSRKEDIGIVLIGRREEKLLETKNMMDNSNEHVSIAVDITNKALLNTRLKENGIGDLNVFGVFANAGVGGENAYGEEDRWGEILKVNLDGTYNTIMECLGFLRNSTEKYKNIIMTSSCLARFGVPNHTAYCTSKAGLLGLTKALAVELASENILVNAICPGWVDTKMARDGIQNLANREGASYKEIFDMQMGFVPSGKMSEPEEIARLVKFLMCNEEVSITGQGIDINNGSFMG